MSTETGFGGFFRESRKALGLTLREFCRRTGNDPGNVSRLERGLAPPPQASEALAALAQALKLQPGSGRWNRFFELAAAATRRIPDEFLPDETAARLPDLFRQLRSGPGHRNWVTARHLEEWAGSLDARAVLPQLVRRLIQATGVGVSDPRFPSGEQVQRPGVDGVVEAAGAGAFVPAGLSFWEMGVDKDPKAKAEADFEKRRKQPLGVEKRKTAYVVVTPRKWQGKGDWEREKRALRTWKEVRVYDSASLEEWLEQAPGVDVWLAEMLGVKPQGLTSIDEYWKNLNALTDPSLLPEAYLASRKAQVEELRGWLKGPPGVLLIETRSPSEAVDFVVAAHCGPPGQDAFAARAVIVETRDAWRSVARSDGELTLIPHPGLAVEPEMVAEAVRQRHRVIVCSGQVRGDEVSVIRLPRALRHDLKSALVSSGMKDAEANDSSQKAGGSLTVLKRLLARFPVTAGPEWGRPPSSVALVPLLLAGSWEETSEGDRAALEKLAGKPYSELAEVAERWLGRPDPPLLRVLTRWGLVSRDDSWFLLAQHVTESHLERFEEVARDVLGQEDPAYELPPDKRWQAGIYRKVPPYSYALKTGLAETLALLGGRPDRLPHKAGVEGRVSALVCGLLDNQEWKRWASLSPQLPLLAEAAPEGFLRVVGRDLGRPESASVKLFEQEGGPLFSSSPHTGLLWALEALAWDRGLLPEVSFVLARLDERAPSGKLGNRPLRSLQEIFMPWFPQTTAPVDERVRLLANIARRLPGPGWRLLLSLLPGGAQVAHPIYRPAWRNWALQWKEGATNYEYWRQVTETSALLLEHVGGDLGRWEELVDKLENLAEPSQEAFFEKLAQLDARRLGPEGQRTLSEALREKVGRHRKFAEAKWALPEDVLSRLEEAQRRFEPDDPVERNAWLFAPHWTVEERAGGGTTDVPELRKHAMRAILSARGWDGALALADVAEAPEEAGYALSQSDGMDHDRKVLPALFDLGNPKRAAFAQGYAWGRFQSAGWEWVERLDVKGWPAAAIGSLACRLPFERKTWRFVKAHGAEAEDFYWRDCNVFPKDESPEDVRYVAQELIRHRQARKACHFAAMALYTPGLAEPTLVAEVLEALADPPPDQGDGRLDGGLGFHIQRMVQELQRCVKEPSPQVDVRRVAKIEWQFLEALDGHPATPETLHTMLSGDPEFLVKVLGVIFRPKSEQEGGKEAEYSEAEKARAHNAYRLLWSWEKVPGSREDGTVDEDALMSWVEAARALARERGHLEVCDTRIGNVFAHAPLEADGSWPCVPVRDALEEYGTEEMFDGLEVGVFNKRGVYRKSATEGGEQERSLSERYLRYAEACRLEWPKTAASLRRIAKNYESDAQREDARAEVDG